MITLVLTAVFIAQTPQPPAEPDRTTPPTSDNPTPVDPAVLEAPPTGITPARVVADFVAHVASSDAYPDSAKRFVADQAGKLSGDPVNLINGSLAILSPDFKKALDQLFDDRYAEAADTLERLARADDPYLAVAAAGLATSAFVELGQIDRCYETIAHVIKTHAPIERYTTSPANIRFMVGYCLVHNLQYEPAFKCLESFLRNYPNAPERLRVAAIQMITELARRAPGRLGDVRDLMTYAGRRISLGDTGEKVTQRQKKAIDLLDALIEEAEEQEKNGDGDGDGGGGGGGGSPGGTGQPKGGANRSALPGGGARDAQLRKTRARPGEAWGRMPPKQRDQILQNLQRQFPSRYRDLLEQYYEQLARDANKP